MIIANSKINIEIKASDLMPPSDSSWNYIVSASVLNLIRLKIADTLS